MSLSDKIKIDRLWVILWLQVIERVGGDSHLQTVALSELDRWSQTHIDVDQLSKSAAALQESNAALQVELQKLREANMVI